MSFGRTQELIYREFWYDVSRWWANDGETVEKIRASDVDVIRVNNVAVRCVKCGFRDAMMGRNAKNPEIRRNRKH